MYKDSIRHFRDSNRGFTNDDVPQVLTIDSSTGKEACMVIFDGSFQHGDDVGKFFLQSSQPTTTISHPLTPPRLSHRRRSRERRHHPF
jgi:hypothetical protein